MHVSFWIPFIVSLNPMLIIIQLSGKLDLVYNASECARTLHTINLQGVRLEKLLVAICVAGVVAHVRSGHLGNVQ